LEDIRYAANLESVAAKLTVMDAARVYRAAFSRSGRERAWVRRHVTPFPLGAGSTRF
jgi:hypothetical protein